MLLASIADIIAPLIAFFHAILVFIHVTAAVVPDTVILLNHYSEGGVKDSPGVNPRLMDYKSTSGHGDSRYSYDASV